MKYEELREKCIALQKECDKKKDELRKQYAIEHNPVKFGDIITDHYHTIKVETMGLFGHPVPYMLFVGEELTVKGVPKKRQPLPPNPVYQPDINTINGEPYKWEEV